MTASRWLAAGALSACALAAILSLTSCPAAVGPGVRIAPDARLVLPRGWVRSDRGPNVVLVKPKVGAKGKDAIVRIFVEMRASHEEALQRLADIAREFKTPPTFLVIDGWPAIERKRTRKAPTIGADVKPRPPRDPDLIETTTAVAAGNLLVRATGQIQTTTDPQVVREVEALGRGLSFGTRPDPAQTARELELVREKGLRAPAPSPEPSEPTPTRDEEERTGVRAGQSFAVGGPFGEEEIATSANGFNVVLGVGNRTAFSSNGGQTFSAFTPPTNLNFRGQGDPSVAMGATGAFYFASLTLPNGSANAFGQTGCAVTMASSPTGATFKLTANAIFCSTNGQGPDDCFPDQEHIAADRKNQGLTGKDQVYVVYREMGSFLSLDCPVKTADGPAIRIACSKDSGVTWTAPIDIDSGDFPRVSVGGDGFVYVTYLSGETVMLNKFSSCKDHLVQQNHFPVQVSDFEEIDCPVVGLDRCDDGNALESSTVAVAQNDDSHVFVAWADHTSDTNEKIMVADSTDGGKHFNRKVRVNANVPGRRFMPWMCTIGGTAHVGWYDRRDAVNGATNDLTAFFRGRAFVSNGQLVRGSEVNVSQVDDPQCASGFPCGARDDDDYEDCTIQPPNPTACPTCQNFCGQGVPKYGDYNGIACVPGHVFSAWASATAPPLVPASPGINVYVDSLTCGKKNAPCCVNGLQCLSNDLVCNSGTCVSCGDASEPCCPSCKANLVCDVNNVCTCGYQGMPCCGGTVCSPGFVCGANGKCQCGNLSQPCCQNNVCTGGLVCSVVEGYKCITTCGHKGQPCCNGTSCNAGLTCAGGTCQCGGLNQLCCAGACNANLGLACVNGMCVKGSSACGQCSTTRTTCLAKCPPLDNYCKCLCQASYCACANGQCGPCLTQDCHPGM
jgi:hypothetical protein